MQKRPKIFMALLGGTLCLFLASAASELLAASIVNEGTTTVKVNGRSPKGIVGGGSIKPGQNLHLKNDMAWIEHVPDGGSAPVSLKIIENDGRVGYINTPGGRYAFQKTTETQPVSAVKTSTTNPPVLADGYAENRSNLAMLLSLIDHRHQQSYQLLLPGQKAVIPKNTVEVIADRHGWSSGDVQIALLIVMPDGQEHTIRTSHAVVRVRSGT